jgi:hypothetical protein
VQDLLPVPRRMEEPNPVEPAHTIAREEPDLYEPFEIEWRDALERFEHAPAYVND